MRRIEDVQGPWRHRKTGKVVEVVSMRRDQLGLRHESGRETYKAEHYFFEEYVRVVPLPQKAAQHPLAIAWDEWLTSAEGQKCAANMTSGFFLENRLYAAFMAGAAATTKEADDE